MYNKSTIFSSAEIMLPKVKDYTKWAVIACDQFTSDIEYWKECERIIDSSPSSYDYILPEAYLGTEEEAPKTTEIKSCMQKIDYSSDFNIINGYIYVERKLSNGKTRCGIVGKLDLEEYDYNKGSVSKIRATEQTVLERIPPRCAIRKAAAIELPHIMVFISDKNGIFDVARKAALCESPIYNFDLMQGGGHLTGYKITDYNADLLGEKLSEYESGSDGISYAIGDGNHSLAAAKAHYESLKSEIGNDALKHTARYALCEIVAIEDESIEFEPIYRVLKNCDTHDVIDKLKKISGSGRQTVEVVTSTDDFKLTFANPTHTLTVGTLQNFIDEYIKFNSGVVCDYIHGRDELQSLSVQPNCIGFLFEGIDKGDLFEYISKNDAYPRKTFSMGDSKSKRYYLEARKIKE